jgi:alpha-L-fucosidase
MPMDYSTTYREHAADHTRCSRHAALTAAPWVRIGVAAVKPAPNIMNPLLAAARFKGLICSAVVLLAASVHAELPPLPSFPDIPEPLPENSVPMADSKSAPELKLGLSIQSGPYAPTWDSIEKNYPGVPDWLRQAKFGIWVHFGPQAAGKSGDWYARNLYKQGSTAYKNHLRNYGHPSEAGYKEVLRNWNPTKLNPAALTALYKEAGARFLIIQGVHHDQFDLWDSKYQPWNSIRLGPKRDLLGEWAQAAKAAGIHYGITFHHEYSWWWWPTAFGADQDGPQRGVPYDGHLTLADGKGKWWEGLDPRLLYGVNLREYQGVVAAGNTGWNPPPAGLFQNHAAYTKWYATWWALRMMDAIDKYDPDFIYTDGTSTQPFSGAGTGTGLKADAMQTVIAHFYNQSLKRRGKVDTFSIVKFRPKTNGTVNTREGNLPPGIKNDQSWIAETPVGDWFYAPGFTNDSGAVIRYLIEQVSRDGNVAICICPLPDGSLDDSTIKMLKEVGQWMRINGEGIYGSTAWDRFGEGPDGRLNVLPGGKIGAKQAKHPFTTADFRFTVGKEGNLYAWCMTVPAPGAELRITSLGSKASPRAIKSVSLLGHTGPLSWKQQDDTLVITCPAAMPFATAAGFKVVTD